MKREAAEPTTTPPKEPERTIRKRHQALHRLSGHRKYLPLLSFCIITITLNAKHQVQPSNTSHSLQQSSCYLHYDSYDKEIYSTYCQSKANSLYQVNYFHVIPFLRFTSLRMVNKHNKAPRKELYVFTSSDQLLSS